MGTQFRYSAPIIVPDKSDVKDKITLEEITYLLNAVRTLAVHLDDVTGALPPLITDWGSQNPADTVKGNYTNKIYARCSANIAFGAMVNLHFLDATHVQARPAQANGFAKAAAGFCNTPGGFTAGQYGEFIVGPGINSGIGGLTPGNWYFLDPTSASGQVTATQPTTPGQIVQICGIAVTNNQLLVGSLNNWIQL